jgi:hypothetical protein
MEFTDGSPDTVAMVTSPMEAVVSDQHAGVIGVPLIVAERLSDGIPVDVTGIKIFTGRLPEPSS